MKQGAGVARTCGTRCRGSKVEKLSLRAIRISPGSQWLGKGVVGRTQLEQRQEGSKGRAGMGCAQNWLLEYKVPGR